MIRVHQRVHRTRCR